MKKKLKRYFGTGLLIIVPLYISVYVFITIVNKIDSFVDMLPEHLRAESYLPFHLPGIGVLITILFVLFVGVIGTNFLGKRLVSVGEKVVDWIPLLRTVYKATKQFMETFYKGEAEGFRRVVLVEFPRKGLFSVGFVTSKTRGEVQDLTKAETVNVFIPTTPNPTTGFYFAVDKDEVQPLSLSIEEAFKVIMSAGVIVPERFEEFKEDDHAMHEEE